jgi:hypothetical protein
LSCPELTRRSGVYVEDFDLASFWPLRLIRAPAVIKETLRASARGGTSLEWLADHQNMSIPLDAVMSIKPRCQR